MKYHWLNSKIPGKANKTIVDDEDDENDDESKQANKITLEDALDFNQKISGKK